MTPTNTVSVDAVNYCHTKALYQAQLNAAQNRCNFNRTTELVLYVDKDNNIIEQSVVTANRQLPELACNLWK